MPKVAFIQKDVYEKVSVHFLAGALKKSNIEYDIFVSDLEDDFYNSILDYNPDYIIYSLFIGEENYAFQFLKEIKKLIPKVVTLVGGPFTLVFPEIYLREEIDFLFLGDGEEELVNFINLHQNNKDLSCVKGIRFIDSNGNAIINGEYYLVDVQKIPFPDRDLYYKYDILASNPTKIVIASRGCPYKCTFCYNTQLSNCFDENFWRVRKIPEIIEEIKYLQEKYTLSWINFPDGTFTANKVWLKEFLTEYAKSNLPEFLCNARIENINEEIIALLKKAGCNRITFGIQSGNYDVRKNIAGRKMENSKIIEACRLCEKYSIRVGVDIIFGWPGETVEQAMDTINLCREINVENYSSNVLIFYPGVSVTNYALKNNFIDKIPTLEEINKLTPNQSLLKDSSKKLMINFDKLFYYFIKFPKLEKLLLQLIKLPPNKLFYMIKNLHFLLRSFKYDKNRSKFSLTKNYFISSYKAVSKN